MVFIMIRHNRSNKKENLFFNNMKVGLGESKMKLLRNDTYTSKRPSKKGIACPPTLPNPSASK